MKKLFVSIVIIQLMMISCRHDTPINDEPEYNANIVWVSKTNLYNIRAMTMDGDFIYAYEYGDESSEFKLTKISAQTGEVQWGAAIQKYPDLYSPVVIDDYIYVFLFDGDFILCFNKQTGDLAAKVRADIDNQLLEIRQNSIGHGKYLYFGLGKKSTNSYFVRLNVDAINKSGSIVEQTIEPEILWQPLYGWGVRSTPVFNNNIVYVHTNVGVGVDASDPLELAGINIDTKKVVFNKQFGIIGDEYYDRGRVDRALFFHENILYYIGESISAWDMKTGEQKYLKTFSYSTLPKNHYAADHHIEVTYWNGKIYYTTCKSNIFGGREGYKNIYCISAGTGNLVWSDMPIYSESLETNPIIAHNRMYVPHGYGLRVYNPENGNLIGVDKRFYGHADSHNILYGDYMITTRYDGPTTTENRVVAVYVGE